MVLYAADLNDLAPTKKISRKRKEAPIEQVEQVEETVEKVEKKKRVLSDEQKENLKKGREARKLKKEQEKVLEQKLLEAAPKRQKKVKTPTPPPDEIEEKETVPEPVAEEPKKKRRVKKTEVKQEVPEVKVEEVKAEPVKKKRASKNEPPTWFKQYVEGVQKEKAAQEGQVSKKQENIIKNEAMRVAKKSWESGYTRDRVQNEVDSHMNRMYSMIFGRA